MKEILLNQLENDFPALDCYRHSYGPNSEDVKSEKYVPIKKVLTTWAENKENLFKLLGSELIIKKNIQFEKTRDELNTELYQDYDVYMYEHNSDEHRAGWEFINNFDKWLDETYPVKFSYHNRFLTAEERAINSANAHMRNYLTDLKSFWTLAANVYEGQSFDIPLKDGRIYTVSNGCKPMRALGKIADSYGIEGFEEFRIKHSLILNQKKTSGELTLSIHPLDYWTMSDNTCDWSSCMSWEEPGGYRGGTVEMMNSPCVVVAYLTASEPYHISSTIEWNNKKWRELFVVSPDVILGIKGYPYRNTNMETAIMDWLKELAETNMGWTYTTNEPYRYTCESDTYITGDPDDEPFHFCFSSNTMYTDVGHVEYHPLYIGTEVRGNNIAKGWQGRRTYYFNYSGPMQCMCCGAISGNCSYFASEGHVFCEECEEVKWCSCCNEAIHGDYYEVEGDTLCSYCYNEETSSCYQCGESYYSNNMRLLNICITPNENDISEDGTYKLNIGWNEYNICPSCWDKFEKTFLKEGCYIKEFEGSYGVHSVVYLDDLNEAGRRNYLSSRIRDALNMGMVQNEAFFKLFDPYGTKLSCELLN